MIDLTGQWAGSYTYPGCLDPVPFTAEIREIDGQLSGVTSEPHEWDVGEEANGTIAGKRSGTHLQFTKLYVLQEDYPDPVFYFGSLDEDGCEVAGDWDIPGVWSGSFVMMRPRQPKVELASEQTATV